MILFRARCPMWCALLINAHGRWRDVCIGIVLDDFSGDAFEYRDGTVSRSQINSEVDSRPGHISCEFRQGSR